MASQLFEETNEIRNILITQLKGNLVHLVGSGEKVAFGLQQDLVFNKFSNGFAEQVFSY